MCAVLFLRAVEGDFHKFLVALKINLLAESLVFAFYHLKLDCAFGNGREVGKAFLIGVDFPMLFRVHAELLNLPTAEEIENNGGIGDRFVRIVLNNHFNCGSGRGGGAGAFYRQRLHQKQRQ